MKRAILAVLLISCLACGFSYCEDIAIENLVSQYSHATDLQRTQLDKHFKYGKVRVSGAVQNVEPWNTFSEAKDLSASYYKVTTARKTAADGTPYEIIIFYKNKESVISLNRGEQIDIECTFIKVLDQRLIFSVWMFAEELTDLDKEMLSS